MATWRELISVDPTVCHGRPCFAKTRIMISVVLVPPRSPRAAQPQPGQELQHPLPRRQQEPLRRRRHHGHRGGAPVPEWRLGRGLAAPGRPRHRHRVGQRQPGDRRARDRRAARRRRGAGGPGRPRAQALRGAELPLPRRAGRLSGRRRAVPGGRQVVRLRPRGGLGGAHLGPVGGLGRPSGRRSAPAGAQRLQGAVPRGLLFRQVHVLRAALRRTAHRGEDPGGPRGPGAGSPSAPSTASRSPTWSSQPPPNRQASPSSTTTPTSTASPRSPACRPSGSYPAEASELDGLRPTAVPSRRRTQRAPSCPLAPTWTAASIAFASTGDLTGGNPDGNFEVFLASIAPHCSAAFTPCSRSSTARRGAALVHHPWYDSVMPAHNPRVSAVVDEELAAWLRRRSEEDGRSVSHVVRRILEERYAEEEERFWAAEGEARLSTFDRDRAASHEEAWG